MTCASGALLPVGPDGHDLFTAIPLNEEESRLFRMNPDGGEMKQLTNHRQLCAHLPAQRIVKKPYFTLRDATDSLLISLWSVPLPEGTPRKELEARAFSSFLLDREAKLAALVNVKDP